MIDFLIIVSITAVIVFVAYYVITKNRSRTIEEELKYHEVEAQNITIDILKTKIQEEINTYTKENLLDKGYKTKEKYESENNQRKRFRAALDRCKFGSRVDKNLVKDFMYDRLTEMIGDDLIDAVLPFEEQFKLVIQDKFEIILYIYKELKDHGNDAMVTLIQEYRLDSIKNVIEDGTDSYIITVEEIENIFNEVYPNYQLSTRDKLNIITQRVYQEIKGLGCIDEIRDQNIDGISGGVSGRIMTDVEEISVSEFIEQYKSNKMNYDSVWFMFEGKNIHLSFLSFKSEAELIRVCINIYRNNRPGELSESIGYKVNDMADNSRVVVARPPFCESWVFFVRKFNKSIRSLEEIYVEEKVAGSKVVTELLKYLVLGQSVLAITGGQGVGKTTVLKAIIKEIKPTLPLRINEMAFEVHGRDIYEDRNIVTFREWGDISGKAGVDFSKKTDGTVNVLGEIATDEVAAIMLDLAQVAYLFTIFTHHAKTTDNLVEAIRNSLLKEDVFRDEKIAVEQVVQVLNFDIHLSKTSEGNRYLERITEIVPVSDPEYDGDFSNLNEHAARIKYYEETVKYYYGVTGRKKYETVNILEYKNGEYQISHKINDNTLNRMKEVMNSKDLEGFESFIKKSWG